MNNEEKLAYWRNAIIALVLNNVENKMPIKEEDMREILDKDKMLFRQCLPLVIQSLKKVYGIILQKVPDTKKYICYSELRVSSTVEYDEEQCRHLTLLFIILSYLLMKDARVDEEQLFDFLKGLRIRIDEEHPYFKDNIKKLIGETFVKQLYLKREKSDSETDLETRFLYSWGYRATVEFPAKDVLQQTAQILGKEPREFVAVYNKYCAEENEETMVVD
ncbi:PREDICTED: melanoma-associated antigen D4 isoform X2 [Rhagoletis zephyria]|uniref:melanoma-associated antigen D4 isoform X2 n=1 Tax=Rhagoletis zephyria TaxID=28612 RepID=UPI0008118356|nr:PREDICTED: melanoma-associated antigen D4 isoform X2 [Rhagoletis zephyria]XP_036319524.1 melanoma-associated antigen D4 isoform X2 [Rhagoletis pomonella]